MTTLNRGLLSRQAAIGDCRSIVKEILDHLGKSASRTAVIQTQIIGHRSSLCQEDCRSCLRMKYSSRKLGTALKTNLLCITYFEGVLNLRFPHFHLLSRAYEPT